MKVTNLVEKLQRVSNKLECILVNAFGTNIHNAEEEYILYKKAESMANQGNLSVSFFEDNLNNQGIDNDSFFDMPSSIDLNETRKFTKSTSNISTINLKQMVHLAGCKIELGELLDILDKHLPCKISKNEINIKSVKEEGSPIKKDVNDEGNKEDNEINKSIYESPERNQSFLNAKEIYYESINNKEKLIECLKHPLGNNILKKFKKISFLLKILIQEQSFLDELNKRDENQDINISQNNKILVHRRHSIFENTFNIGTYHGISVPSGNFSTLNSVYQKLEVKECQINITSNFFEDMKKRKKNKKKRNTLAGGRLRNKLKQLNKLLNNPKMMIEEPKSEIQKKKGREVDDSSLSENKNFESEKNEIKNALLNQSVTGGNDSILTNGRESFCKNENISGSNDNKEGREFRAGKEIKGFERLSEVKIKRGSEFFDPSQLTEISNLLIEDQKKKNEGVINEKGIEEENSSDLEDSISSDSVSENEGNIEEENKERYSDDEEVFDNKNGMDDKQEKGEKEDTFEEKQKNNNEESFSDDEEENLYNSIKINTSICFDKLY